MEHVKRVGTAFFAGQAGHFGYSAIVERKLDEILSRK